MENSQKFSNPLSSLNISKRTEDGSSSSASTPSEDYKTPSLEHVAIPGFDFGIRESEPEAPSKLLQDAGMPRCLVGDAERVIFPQECIGVSASVLPKSLNFSQVSSPSVTICGTKSPTRHFGAGHGLIVNGTNAKVSTFKHCNESSVIPLIRSPTTSRQVKKTFAKSPNQTTWLEETVQRGSSLERDQSKVTCNVMRSQSAELSGIRHKLEERRKQIENEKKKMEMQWSKQRQQVGKEAFIQVVTKQHFGSSFQNDIKIRMQKARPASYREVADEKLMLIREQEQQSPKPLLCDSETDRGSALHLVSSSLSRTENVKEFGTGKLLTENSSDSSGSNNKTKVSLKENVHVKTNKVSQRKVSSPMNASAGYHSDVSEYGTSLDRLNSSLTELQGEIMRLSLQQDQIKSLVGSDLEPALESAKSFSSPVSPQKAKDQFYLFPRNTSGTISGTRQPTVSSFDNSVVCGVNGSSVSHVSGQNSASSFGSSTATGTETFENPRGFVSPGHEMPLRGELLPSGSNPMNAPNYANQQRAYPHYYPMPRVPYLDGTGYSMRMTNLVHPSVSHIPVSQQGSVNLPVHNFDPRAGLWHAVGPVHRSGDGDTVTGDTTMTELMKTQQIPSSSGLSDHDVAVNDKMSEVAVPLKSDQIPSPLLLKSGLQCSDSKNYDHQNIPTSSTYLSSPDNCTCSMPSFLRAEYKPMNIPLSESENETLPSSAPSETFFMVLESDLPRRPKPVLSVNYRKKEAVSTAMPDSYSIPTIDKVEITVDGKTAPGSVLCASPSVGFVIGCEESFKNQELQQEVEKKRQQMAEMHQRRREELELKKQKIEIEQQTKREVLRLKQEKDYEKRAKEKVRREEIFQSYLQRKAEEDGSEDDSKISSRGTGKQPVKSRAKLHRPKSQPPPSSDINLNERVRGFCTPSPVGGHVTDPRTESPSSDLSRSSEHLNSVTTNFEHLEARLASGYRGQQTPSVADRVPRFLSSSSDGGSDAGIGGCQMPDNYAGPKLFVKPSQKSNRHIILNAIKDCCLAGLVNQEMKNKVVEEMNKSDSKHFVILFRDAGMQYRGLYTYNPEREDVFKIHGVGPNRLLDKTMEKFYKYNSGAKIFTEVTSTKHLSATIDAITILGVLWQKKPSTGQSKRLI